MKWHHDRNPEQFRRIAHYVFGVATTGQGIASLETWFDKIGTPTRLSQFGITRADLPAIIENVLGNARWFGIADLYKQGCRHRHPAQCAVTNRQENSIATT